MTVFERIVVGADGTEAALAALRQARRLLVPQGRLVSVTVSDLSAAVQAAWSAPGIAAELRREAAAARDEAARELAALPFAEARLADGSATAQLLDAIRRERATLVAVGSHGGGRAVGILLGGVATTLLHDAPCSVLVARQVEDVESFPRSIVAGVDGSRESLRAAEAAEALADRLGASLRLVAATGGKLVHVDGLVKLETRRPALAGGGGSEHAPALAWSDLPPVDALLEAAADADLLVIGSRGLHGVAALGSVSERVAHRARCSVLVVRAAAA